MTQRIIYDIQTIETILNLLNTLPIVGIDSANKMVKVFDLLKQYEVEAEKEVEKEIKEAI